MTQYDKAHLIRGIRYNSALPSYTKSKLLFMRKCVVDITEQLENRKREIMEENKDRPLWAVESSMTIDLIQRQLKAYRKDIKLLDEYIDIRRGSVLYTGLYFSHKKGEIENGKVKKKETSCR